MKKLNKIGLTIFASTLFASSAFAGSMSVSGSAQLIYGTSDADGVTGNAFSMDDSIVFSGSGELDNGMTISVSAELDGDSGTANTKFDDRKMSIGMGEMGTLTFEGHGGASVLADWDDKTPNAYEEVWDGVSGADGDIIDGVAVENQFQYKSPEFSGTTLYASYAKGDAVASSASDVSNIDYGIQYKGVEGLELGYAFGDKESTVGSKFDQNILYAKYAYGPITVGYSVSENDAETANRDIESTAVGISYAVTDDFTVAYGVHEIEYDQYTSDQEASGFSASYTTGGMTIGGMMNNVDNVGGTAATDTKGYEISISFAF